MVKEIKTRPYHFVMRARNGNTYQVCKAIQEMNELCLACEIKDRDLIVEEMADVILTYPYLRLGVAEQMATFLYNDNNRVLTIEVITPIFITLLKLHEQSEFSSSLTMCVIKMSQLFLNALNVVIKEYDIRDDEIDRIIEFKKRRTIKEFFGGKLWG